MKRTILRTLSLIMAVVVVGTSANLSVLAEEIKDEYIHNEAEASEEEYIRKEAEELGDEYINNDFAGDELPLPVSKTVVSTLPNGTKSTLTWSIDIDGKLTIDGRGDIEKTFNWNSYGTYFFPWCEYGLHDQIKSAVIKWTDMTDLSYLFYLCHKITSLDISGLDTSSVTNMENMFIGIGVTGLDLSGINTSNVTNMQSMFYGSYQLTALDLSGFDTRKVTDMSHMFQGCHGLNSIVLSSFDTSNVTNMARMFESCSGLSSLNVDNFDTSLVENMDHMFSMCSGISSLNVSGFNTSNVTNMAHMFYSCNGLSNLDVSNFNTEKVTDISYMFWNCSGLASIDVNGFKTNNVTNMRGIFKECRGLTALNITNFDTSNVEHMDELFQGCSSLDDIDISRINTDKVTTMEFMFADCTGISEIDLSKINTSNVVSMRGMFSRCTGLTSVDLSLFDMGKVKADAYPKNTNLFEGCSNLTTIQCPLNLKVDSFLPGDGKAWVTKRGEVFDKLPRGLTSSIQLNCVDSDAIAGRILYQDMFNFKNEMTFNMTDSDWYDFLNGLTEGSKKEVTRWRNKLFNTSAGHCYGGATLVASYKKGYFDPVNYGGCSTIHDLTLNNVNFVSTLTRYFFGQYTNTYTNAEKEFGKKSLNQKLNFIINAAKNIESNGHIVFVFQLENKGLHAVLIDGIEEGSYEVNGQTFKYKLTTYDVNNPKAYYDSSDGSFIPYNDGGGDIYIDSTKSKWTMKHYEYIDGKCLSGWDGNNRIKCAFYADDLIQASYRKEKSGNNKSVSYTTSSIGCSIDVDGTKVNIVDGDLESDPGIDLFLSGTIAGDASDTRIYLPDDAEKISLKLDETSTEDMTFSGRVDDELISVAAETSNITFADGLKSVSFESNEGDYSIDIVSDCVSTEAISIAGCSNGDISMITDDNGIHLSSSNDNSFVISDGTITSDTITNSNVLIKNDDDNNVLIVSESDNKKIGVITADGYIDDKVVVSLDSVGGDMMAKPPVVDSVTGSVAKKTVPYKGVYGELPVPQKVGYIFEGWYTGEKSGNLVNENTPVSNAFDHTLYARWKPMSVVVTFNPNGGTVDTTSKNVLYNEKFGELPVPALSGYNFAGWYLQENPENNVNPIDANSIVNYLDEVTLYAHWVVSGVTVYFDANGGTVSPASKMVSFGEKFGELPVATKENVVFVGWSTSPTGNTLITENTIVDVKGSVTLYAIFDEINIALKQKYDMSKLYTNSANFDKYKIESLNGGKATITKKGILTATRAGQVRVTPLVKEGRKYVPAKDVEPVVFEIIKPVMEKCTGSYIGQTISGNQLILSKPKNSNKVTWSVPNTKVCSVNSETGEVTVNGKGNVKITATITNNQGYSTKISTSLSVKFPKLSTKDSFTMKKGKTRVITLANVPTNRDTNWKIEKNGVVEIIGGTGNKRKIKAVGAGSTKITVTYEGQTYTTVVTVNE